MTESWKTLDLRQLDMNALLPQREPFRFVDALLSFSPERVVTAFTVRADGPLHADGCLTPEGMVENMAQTCAARIGFIHKYIQMKPVSVGYLVSVRRMEVFSRVRAGMRLETTVEIVQEVEALSKADATIRCGEELIARASLGIADTEEEVRL